MRRSIAETRVALEQEFNTNPFLVFSEQSNLKEWTRLFLSLFSKEDKVSFLANKEWFRFKGFSQYVDKLFSKGKEKDYDAYRRLPQNLRNQICTALFSSMLQEVEMYIKTRVLVYFHTIVQLDLDGWSRYSL